MQYTVGGKVVFDERKGDNTATLSFTFGELSHVLGHILRGNARWSAILDPSQIVLAS